MQLQSNYMAANAFAARKTNTTRFAGEEEKKFCKDQMKKYLSPTDPKGDLLELHGIEQMATSANRREASGHIRTSRESERKLTQWVGDFVKMLVHEKRSGQPANLEDPKFTNVATHGFTTGDFRSATSTQQPGTAEFKQAADDLLNKDLRPAIHELLVEQGIKSA